MDESTKKTLFESLDNAISNGYENTLINEPLEVAEDLAEYDSQFEGMEPSLLAPAIAEWQLVHAAEAIKVRESLGLK